jgi:two-component system sensor kinase FixL
VRKGDRILHFETTRLHKNGEVVPVSLTISPILDANKVIVGVSKIARDLTEQKDRLRRLSELQAELAQVARLTELGQIAAALAHEINQPLTAITNYLNATRRLLAARNFEGSGEAVGRAAEQAARAAQIVQRLRTYLCKGKVERQIENLPMVIEDVTALALIGVDKEIRLNTEFDPQASVALIDKVQIQQVIFNLIRNAIEAMVSSPRREVLIVTTGDDDMVMISVADTGPGLPEIVRTKLFQPFNTTKNDGMGVGLSICRTIVEAHDGKISAGETVGGGTTVYFTLPRGPAKLACSAFVRETT